MEKVIYTPKLKEHLSLVAKTCETFEDKTEGKSLEQFLNEIEFIKNLLDEAKELVH